MGREQEDDEAARAEPAPDPVQAAPATEERARVSIVERGARQEPAGGRHDHEKRERHRGTDNDAAERPGPRGRSRSEEHTSELQSPCNLVCRLLLEKKKK